LHLKHGIDTYIVDTGAFTPTIRSVLADRAAKRIVGRPHALPVALLA
jgi:hypothetical protein